jgi:hypothetical protein
MKKKNTPQPRNYLVRLALFRKAGSHKKSNKALRRLEKSKKSSYSEAYCHLIHICGVLPAHLPRVSNRFETIA